MVEDDEATSSPGPPVLMGLVDLAPREVHDSVDLVPEGMAPLSPWAVSDAAIVSRPLAAVFEFRKWGSLTDGVVDVSVEEEEPADPAKGHVPCYHLRVSEHGGSQRIGEIRLRIGSAKTHPSLLTSGHLGYEVYEDACGHGYATRACVLVGQIPLAHGLDPVLITCDPQNVASVRTCERLAATLVGGFDVPSDHRMYREGRRVYRYEWRPKGLVDR